MTKDMLEHWSDPVKRQKARKHIEKRIAEIREDKELLQKKEHYTLDFDLEGVPLIQFKTVEVIFREILGNEEDDLLLYLVYKGLEYEMMKLGIARQALLTNVANSYGMDLPEADRIL